MSEAKQIAFYCSKELKAKIIEAARNENRSISKYIVMILKDKLGVQDGG